MTMMQAVRRFVVALVLVGCASQGKFPQLAQPERDLFFRCEPHIREAICPGSLAKEDALGRASCTRAGEAKYADAEEKRGREEWLLANGCPPSMVRPQDYSGKP